MKGYFIQSQFPPKYRVINIIHEALLNFSQINNTIPSILCLGEGLWKGEFLVQRTNLLVCYSKCSFYETFMKQLCVFSLERKENDKILEIFL